MPLDDFLKSLLTPFLLSPSNTTTSIHAFSKVNTPLNAGLTHFHCGWLCFQFSHHFAPPTTTFLDKKRKVLSRKQNKTKSIQPDMQKGSNIFCKLLCFKETKACMPKPRGGMGLSRACFSLFLCGSELVIAVFLPFFLFGRAWERPQHTAEKPQGSQQQEEAGNLSNSGRPKKGRERG